MKPWTWTESPREREEEAKDSALEGDEQELAPEHPERQQRHQGGVWSQKIQ